MSVGGWFLGVVTGSVGGTLISAMLTARREETKRRLEWCSKQLSEFYAPMHAIRREILAVSNFRVKVQGSSQKRMYEKQNLADKETMGYESYAKYIHQVTEVYTADMPHFKERYDDILRPLYLRMRDLFRDKLQYADADTLKFYDTFISYMETQEIIGKVNLPIDVVQDIRTWENEIHPFYDHLESKVLTLSEAVRTGGVPGYTPVLTRVRNYLNSDVQLRRHS